ncbi:MAG: hypothetical protein EOM18_06180 [Clostridia bacterium]|nr:hypothetical protein [Clostridia bacterium]
MNRGLEIPRVYYYEMEICAKDYFKLKPFCKKTQSKIIIIEKHGMPFFFHKNKKRKAFFLGIFLFAASIYLCSLFIWDIRIDGNHFNSDEVILDMLKQIQINDGIMKKNIDCQNVSARMREAFPNVIWVSARIEGTCLMIDIKENEDSYQEEDEVGEDLDAWSLAAPKDGRIISIITRSGMPMMHEGEVCKKGDILVSGRVEILNNESEIIRYEQVRADADIRIKTEYAYYDEFSLHYTKKEYIGEKKEYPVIGLFGKEYFYCPKKSLPAEVYKSVKPVYLTSSFCIPLSFGRISWIPYKVNNCVYNENEAKQRADEKLQQFLVTLVGQDILVCEKKINLKITSQKCIAKGVVTVIEEAKKKVPIEDPNEKLIEE